MKRSFSGYWMAAAGVLLLGGGVWAWSFLGAKSADEAVYTQAVQLIEHEVVMRERGVLVSSGTTPVELQASGEIISIIESGSTVAAGDVVITVDTSSQRDKLRELELKIATLDIEYQVHRAQRESVRVEHENRIATTSNRLLMAKMELELLERGLDRAARRQLEIDRELSALALADAREALERQERLLKKGFISEVAVVPFRRKVVSAEAGLQEADAKIRIRTRLANADELLDVRTRIERYEGDLGRGERAKQRRLAKVDAQCEEAMAKLREERQDVATVSNELMSASTVAPVDGIVKIRMYRDWRNGGVWKAYKAGVRRGRFDRVADIVKPGVMSVLLMVNESDVMKLRTGIVARVSLPALPEQSYSGRLVSLGGVGQDRGDMASGGTEERGAGVSVFRAKVAIDANDERFRPGMSADVDLVLEGVASALVVAVDAIESVDGVHWARVVSKKGRIERRKVTGKVMDHHWFRVLGGLVEGDLVRVPRAPEGEVR